MNMSQDYRLPHTQRFLQLFIYAGYNRSSTSWVGRGCGPLVKKRWMNSPIVTYFSCVTYIRQ